MKPIDVKFLIIAAILSLSCTTKVSEWVLLNSPADKYLLVYYHHQDIPQPVVMQHNGLQKKLQPANVLFRSVEKENIEQPYYALYYYNRLFATYKDFSRLENIAFSPVREKIGAELMEGRLCVMVYLKTGDREKDERGLQVVKNTIAASPFGNIISLVELDRKSAEEAHFVSMLLNVEGDLKDIHEPMLFGVFGRFRVLEPLLARGISGENINLLIDFLTADCSCLIKDKLPGISMLSATDWNNPRPALVNDILDANPQLIHQ